MTTTLRSDVLMTDTEYGVALLDERTGAYYTLNPTAALVVRSGGFGDDELRDAGAAGIYDTPADLAAALDDTPLA